MDELTFMPRGEHNAEYTTLEPETSIHQVYSPFWKNRKHLHRK